MESFFSKNGTDTYFSINIKTVPSVPSLQIYMQICRKGILPKLSVEFVYIHTEYEKQPPEVLYKKAVINNCCNIRRKTHALKSLFNKIADLKACIFIKASWKHRCFYAFEKRV